MRQISPGKYGIAYLDRTIFIADKIRVVPRMQPLLAPEDASIMAVVRIEERGDHAGIDAPGLETAVADQIAAASRKPHVSALQIDFDAPRSQQRFYRGVIEETRRRIPAGMPLSITALASWCSRPGWLEGLPVDEAVPMLFRMGGDRWSRKMPGWDYKAGNHRCQSSVGVSMDEAWPSIDPRRRIYVFHPRGWNTVALANLEKLIEP